MSDRILVKGELIKLLPILMGLLPVAAGLISGTPRAHAQTSYTRMVAATNVVCRSGPSTSSEGIGSPSLGALAQVLDRRPITPDAGQGGSEPLEWLRVTGPSLRGECWIRSDLTVPNDPGNRAPAAVAVADRALEQSEDAARDGRLPGTGPTSPFADLVAVHNFLLQQLQWGVGEERPLVELRRLQVLDAAVGLVDRWDQDRDPVPFGYALAHAPVVEYFPPGGLFTVSLEAFWELADRYAGTPFGDELAWAAGSRPRYDDCEGWVGCYLGRITETFAQYWARYPEGSHLGEAMARAVGMAEWIADCSSYRGYDETVAEQVGAIRGSLAEVALSTRAELEVLLDQIEGGCPSDSQGLQRRP